MWSSDLKFLLKFQTSLIYEEISQTYMTVSGTDSTVSIPSTGSGYVMQNDQYLVGSASGAGYPLNLASAFTLGFWLKSVNPGFVTDEVTGDPESITMPLLNFVGSINPSDVLSDSVIEVTEITNAAEMNQMKISLKDGAYYALTTSYTPDLWHHFWIVYDGSTFSVRIDGEETILSSETGSLPVSLSATTFDVYINHSFTGYAYNVAKNYGYIDELFLYNTANTEDIDVQRVINDNINYIANSNYTTINNDGYSIYFNDPDTITVTSVIDDMTYIYLGVNDGRILRGSPLLWETRRVFSNSDEKNIIDETISDGFLKINNGVIRL